MKARIVNSKAFRELGPFRPIQAGLYQSRSKSVYMFGEGQVWGKGEGTLCLDQARHDIRGYGVPRSLVLCDDFSLILPRPIGRSDPITALPPEKVSDLFDLFKKLQFSSALAIRSSSCVEDQLGQTAAGKFRTEMHASPLDTEESKRKFVAKLLAVYNSAYSEEALKYYKKLGYTEIPPLAVIIQEVVGNQWRYAPRYFLPALSGIVNTASRRVVRVSTVLGLGMAAVGDAGLGILHRLPILESGLEVGHNMNRFKGKLNRSEAYCLDRNSGDVLKIEGSDTPALFPDEFTKDVQFYFPEPQKLAAGLSLQFERRYGFPVDVEWASKDGENISLVQVRPINKRLILSKPTVDKENIIVNSRDVFGFGEAEFDHIIYVNSESLPEEIGRRTKELCKTYPRSLVIIRTYVTADTQTKIYKNYLAITKALVINNSN